MSERRRGAIPQTLEEENRKLRAEIERRRADREDDKRIITELKEKLTPRQRIGVYDYESVCKLLEVTWTRLYDSPPRDPQDIIQHMEADIMTLRKSHQDEFKDFRS